MNFKDLSEFLIDNNRADVVEELAKEYDRGGDLQEAVDAGVTEQKFCWLLDRAMVWDETAMGHAYWVKVHIDLRHLEG